MVKYNTLPQATPVHKLLDVPEKVQPNSDVLDMTRLEADVHKIAFPSMTDEEKGWWDDLFQFQL